MTSYNRSECIFSEKRIHSSLKFVYKRHSRLRFVNMIGMKEGFATKSTQSNNRWVWYFIKSYRSGHNKNGTQTSSSYQDGYKTSNNVNIWIYLCSLLIWNSKQTFILGASFVRVTSSSFVQNIKTWREKSLSKLSDILEWNVGRFVFQYLHNAVVILLTITAWHSKFYFFKKFNLKLRPFNYFYAFKLKIFLNYSKND